MPWGLEARKPPRLYLSMWGEGLVKEEGGWLWGRG